MSDPAKAEEILAPESTRPAAILAEGLSMSYVGGDGAALKVLEGVDLRVVGGEVVAIIGESGSGKSTLLHLLGGLDRPAAGEVHIAGTRLQSLDDDELSRVRAERIGFVFQFHHLLKEFSALENVVMPQLIVGRGKREAQDRAKELLADVGLTDRATHKPTQLSGGEQQRVALARALANRPVVLLADEPTGNLDTSTSATVQDILFEVAARHQSAMVLVTHDMRLAARADRILALEEGRLVPAAPRRPD